MRQDSTPAQLYSTVFGAVLLVVGIVGFFVNAQFGTGSKPPGENLILFKVNGWHNIVHIASGVAGLALARTPAGARLFALGFGTVYAIVTLYGLVAGSNVLGILALNGADNVLHLVIAAAGLAAYAASRARAPEPRVAAAVRPRGCVPPRARSEPALLVASLAWAAGIMHAAASAQHLHEWPAAAVFFAVLAVAQVGLGVWLWARPDGRALVAAAAGSAAVVALWAVSRTAGLPFGPEAGDPESVGVLDVLATADELLLVACAVALARGGGRVLLHPAVVRVALVASLAGAMLGGGHSH
jgi:hypothetical protein